MKRSCLLMPVGFGIGGVAERNGLQMRLRQRDKTAGAPVAGRKPGCRLENGDLAFKADKRIELELLLGIPFVRHMRHKRAEQTAAGTLPDRSCIDQQRIDALPLGVNRRPQTHASSRRLPADVKKRPLPL